MYARSKNRKLPQSLESNVFQELLCHVFCSSKNPQSLFRAIPRFYKAQENNLRRASQKGCPVSLLNLFSEHEVAKPRRHWNQVEGLSTTFLILFARFEKNSFANKLSTIFFGVGYFLNSCTPQTATVQLKLIFIGKLYFCVFKRHVGRLVQTKVQKKTSSISH